MEKREKDLMIHIEDKYGEHCFNDSCNMKLEGNKRKPQGIVQIYEVDENGTKILYEKNNLVVYEARKLVAQKIIDTNSAHINPDKDEFLCWFGLGNGGVDPADPLNPTPPTNSDTDLSNSILINATDATCGQLGYKHPFDSVDFEQDIYNDDEYLILKVTTTIGADDANGFQLSEAGLFTALSSAGGYSGNFSLFARVTFPSIVKTATRRLIFIWYLYV